MCAQSFDRMTPASEGGRYKVQDNRRARHAMPYKNEVEVWARLVPAEGKYKAELSFAE
jgi:hypothetical protein